MPKIEEAGGRKKKHKEDRRSRGAGRGNMSSIC